MFIDDSACNLASLNLMKFRNADGNFNIAAFKKAVEIIITAQEIIIDNASYPTQAIEQNSFNFRTLGIGYANLGALLMILGLPYDSNEGRNYAATITSLMTSQAYLQSAKISSFKGTFKFYEINKEPMLQVIKMHKEAADKIDNRGVSSDLLQSSKETWDRTLALGNEFGFRNAQVSLLAPTGTIGFLMDCDTTGIEPDIALVKYKWLVGGGLMKIVNNIVPLSLKTLGYLPEEIDSIIEYIDKHETIEGAPKLKEDHLPVFDCAFKPKKGQRTIHYMGHIKMMGAVQPFLSGAISKTVNLPHEATSKDIEEVYLTAWKLDLKAVAIYRDGSKQIQPLTTALTKEKGQHTTTKIIKPARKRMPDERQAITHKFSIANHEGYLTVGLYEDGMPGELFITMSKEGSVISGLMDSFATSISIGIQYGVPLKALVNRFVHTRFEPSGFTNNPNIRIAKSIVDYIFRWLAIKFLPPEDLLYVGLNNVETITNGNGKGELEKLTKLADAETLKHEEKIHQNKADEEGVVYQQTAIDLSYKETFDMQSDAPICDTCGSMMIRSGACYKCLNCGSTTGCS
jgi:ribonucleoside-diphosphate reductase alpha chain